MKVLILFVFFVFELSFSQVVTDTTYNINSVYAKEIKKFPYLKKVEQIESNQLSCLKNVPYKSIHNRDLAIDVFYVNDAKLHPGLVLIHGGGWKSGNKDQMHALAQAIAKNGFTCVCVEYRLADEAKYPAGVRDIKSAIHYVKKHALELKVDLNKIAVLGCSSGGQIAALVGTTNGTSIFTENNETIDANVHAIVDLDGILAFKHPESKEGKMASYWLNGTYEERPEVWQEASALTHCNGNTPPILFVNSPFIRFHAGEQDMIEKLEKNKVYYEVKTFADSPHSFWFFNPWFDDVVKTSTQFLNKIFYNSTD